MININYYTVHRSGCSLKRDSLIDPRRLYISTEDLGIEEIKLSCDFKGMPDQILKLVLFTVDYEIDYNSYNSLN